VSDPRAGRVTSATAALIASLWVAACATTGPSSQAGHLTTPASESSSARTEPNPTQVAHKLKQAEEYARELESRIALLESQNRELKTQLGELREPPSRTQTVRIGKQHRHNDTGEFADSDDSADSSGAAEPSASAYAEAGDPNALEPARDVAPRRGSRSAQPRPVLRLYGRGTWEPGAPLSSPASAPLIAPDEKLEVMPVPSSASTPSWASSTGASTTPVASSPERAEYQQALQDYTSRRYDAAWSSFAALATKYPGSPYAMQARYWQAEASYAARNYKRALGEFGYVVQNAPRSPKASEALWKISLCHKRLGNTQQQQQTIERLRREFPSSVSAKLATKEIE
jgi:tol-pal system protein YbgF